MDAVDDDLLANVHDFQIGEMLLISIFVDGLVDLLIVPNACSKVDCGLLWVLALVVRTGCLDISYVCHDKVLVVALGLDVYDLYAGVGADLEDPPAALLGRVGGVQQGNDAVLVAEPLEHVGHGCLRRSLPLALALCIGGVEEVGGGLCGGFATVVADIEGLGGYGEPL